MEHNPYAKPTAEVRDNPSVPEGRPWQVWVIFVFIMFGAVSNAGFLAMLAAGKFPMTPESSQYFSGFGGLDYSLSLISLAVYVAAAIALLRMRRIALKLMVVHLVLSLGLIAYQFTRPGYSDMMAQASGLVGLIVGEVLMAVITLYTYSLFKAGRLS
jgi:hypothetical protein